MLLNFKNYEHKRFSLLVVLLSVLVFIRYGFEIDIPRIILTIIIFIIAALGDTDEIIAIVMCCIPLHEAIDLYSSIGICGLILLFKNHKNIKINPLFILFFLMVIWELLHCFNSEFSVKLFFISILPILFLTIVLCIDISNVDYAFIVRSVAYILVVSCITLLFNNIISADYNLMVAFSNLRRLGLSVDKSVMLGSVINPNSLGIICVLLLAGYLQLRMSKKNNKSDIFVMAILLIFGTLTSSRTFFICLILMIVLFLFGQKGKLNEKVKFILLIIVTVLVVLLFLNKFFPDLLEYYIGRFSSKDITTGRDTLMSIYHKYILENLDVMFYGIGLTDYSYKLVDMYYVANNVPHNAIQEIIVAWGIFGFIILMAFLICLFLNSRKYCYKHTLINFIPIIIILTKSMAGQLLTSSYTILALSYAYLSLCQNFNNNESAAIREKLAE